MFSLAAAVGLKRAIVSTFSGVGSARDCIGNVTYARVSIVAGRVSSVTAGRAGPASNGDRGKNAERALPEIGLR